MSGLIQLPITLASRQASPRWQSLRRERHYELVPSLVEVSRGITNYFYFRHTVLGNGLSTSIRIIS
ncbi:hypothetical protein LC605_26290 [Nostoc sp. CHAB 5836]|uniref:hypothetical protein n=1 Tax=Nostoc sp. CHAB 5836 TaxID=2780404 RepID=UPI001E4BE877|nr:hypothetical protein [Nostoc sp. CHAB 5836]MCC5618533.1 hypothetical protein [Nostoc sp. CHAB 5836]